MSQVSPGMKARTINEIISFQAYKQKDKLFLLYQPLNKKITYQAFDELTLRTAKLLLNLGIAKGDRVGLMLGNSTEFLLVYFGTLRIGGVIVPMNPTLSDNSVRNILSHSGAKAFITNAKNLNLQELQKASPSLKHVMLLEDTRDGLLDKFEHSQDLKSAPELIDFTGVSLDNVATLLYTSGTTGSPKGVTLTQRNLVVNAYDIAEALSLGNARMMCVLPLHHTNGQIINVLSPLISGGSVVLCEAYNVFSLSQFWDTISAYQANVVDVVPTVLALLLRFKTKKKVDIRSLDYIICGAAPLPVPLEKEFEEKLNCIIVQEYGLTEATCVSSINSVNRKKTGSIGLPLASNEMRIVDNAGTELPTGEVGEIIIRGENVMQGYYGRPDLTRKVIKDGWLYTGDLGKVDADGFFYIVGRKKDIIIKGGENIYPVDIDNALYKHPAVSECATVGIPDNIYGEDIKAYVILKKGKLANSKELVDFCRENLPPFWCPKVIEVVDHIPRTASGKVIKRKLEPSMR